VLLPVSHNKGNINFKVLQEDKKDISMNGTFYPFNFGELIIYGDFNCAIRTLALMTTQLVFGLFSRKKAKNDSWRAVAVLQST
jgi:hypothetical protein